MATIKELREQKGWSQTDLANESGLAVVTISRIENGHPANSSTLKHLSRALGVKPEQIQGVEISRRRKHE